MKTSSLIRACLVACSLILAACASSGKFQQDYKNGAQFNDLHTYQWRALSLEIDGASQAQLQQLLDAQLLRQGYRLVDSNPDMLLDAQAFSRAKQGGNTGIGIGIGLPVGRNGSIGLGTSQILNGKTKQEAVIVVDITRSDTNTLVWRGNAEAMPLNYFELRNEDKLRTSISSLLSQFPPK